jgi:hypothetical protein
MLLEMVFRFSNIKDIDSRPRVNIWCADSMSFAMFAVIIVDDPELVSCRSSCITQSVEGSMYGSTKILSTEPNVFLRIWLSAFGVYDVFYAGMPPGSMSRF